MADTESDYICNKAFSFIFSSVKCINSRPLMHITFEDKSLQEAIAGDIVSFDFGIPINIWALRIFVNAYKIWI